MTSNQSALELTKIEKEQARADDHNETPPGDVIAFNELRSCADLLRLQQNGQLILQPDFQRDIVWQKNDQARFIDSLTKQLPIPSMCMSLDYKTDERVVIDGLQRINTIVQFLSNDDWSLSKLEDIDQRISNKTAGQIKKEYPELYARVENVMIPITVIRCNHSVKSHMEYLYTIFYRLNSGGAKLNSQEIRNCIYTGSFNTLLKELASTKAANNVLGRSRRFSTEEYLLRFFTFNNHLESYNGKLSKYLNDYMFDKRYADQEELDGLRQRFLKTASIVDNRIKATKPLTKKMSRTTAEGLLLGISQNLGRIDAIDDAALNKLFKKFLELPEFSAESLKEGLSSKKNVVGRLTAAKRCFAG